MKLTTTDIFKRLGNNNPNLIILNDKQIKKLQKTILTIADDVIGICEEEKINYHLTGGTCLGAVRHQGFIPWDDDIDIDVAREDIDKLLNKIEEKYNDKYYIHNPYNKDGYSIPNTQIRLKNTLVRGCNDVDSKQAGAYIDISVMENTFDNKVLRKIHGVVSLALGLIVSCRKFNKNKKYLLKLAKGDTEATKVFKNKILIGKILSFLTLRRWTIIYDNWNKICKNTKTKYVTVPTGRKHFFGELYERNDFYETTKKDFEGRKWNVPKKYDKYLKTMYGDYNKLPDEEEKERHTLIEFKL